MIRSMLSRRAVLGAATAALAAAVFAVPALAATQLTGAGSSFDFPFFSKAFYEYSQQHSDVTINYQSIGSGGGIQQFTAKTVDFGATDVPMTSAELERAGNGVVQVPVALGGVAIAYNLPSVSSLKLTRQAIVDIYLGKIAKWNDAAIAKLNPGASLPDLPIIPVHRSDGSGTTYIFTDFLSHVSADWKSSVGVGKSVQWPGSAAVGGKGNEGVAGAVRQTPGSIGYVELAYALENKMEAAQLQNAAGTWLSCTAATVKAAAAAKPSVSATDFSIVDEKAPNAYPISGYSWVVLYADPADKARGKTLHDVMEWVVGPQAQAIAGTLNYVPLPENVQETAKKALAGIKV